MRGMRKIMDDDGFRVSGPLHLATVNWDRPDHECAVMACLVQATYVLERDHKRSREPLAPAWWVSFGFELVDTFIVDKDTSIFGAIYRNTRYSNRNPQAPRFVIAFRGTILEAANGDTSHDLLADNSDLGSASQLKKVMQKIVYHISEFGAEGAFLAGHSLGSTMAMLVGANLATKGISLKTFLFNLPSCLTEEESSKRLISRFLQITPWVAGFAGAFGMFPLAAIAYLSTAVSLFTSSSLVAATGIATLTSLAALAGASVLKLKKRSRLGEMSLFAPYIFVNPEDPVCKNWIPYFCNQPRENGRSRLEFADFVESAVLKINSIPGQDMLKANSLKQWWQQGIKLLNLDEYGSH
ncbi:alpha/beta-Hydrolases superfamily protein [Rhynchospora pubera]|uniref:Alpha/beta-Hydrolases superfamily protein n=1 Tax=Rhynchospora pubera TaxID=906938 RepID=A0AAV8HHQ3_9POAL|nr:alpha/beta-Hydrolases superfamily protein [Rhynchospora pubera]